MRIWYLSFKAVVLVITVALVAHASYAAESPGAAQQQAAFQRLAVARFPDLGLKDSPLNLLFRQRFQELQAARSTYLSTPDWPLRLAKDCAAEFQGSPKFGLAASPSSEQILSSSKASRLPGGPTSADQVISPTLSLAIVIIFIVLAGLASLMLVSHYRSGETSSHSLRCSVWKILIELFT